MTSTITMSPLEVVEGIAVFRIAGQCGLPDAVAMIGSAFDQAFREHHDRCLIDASAGFQALERRASPPATRWCAAGPKPPVES